MFPLKVKRSLFFLCFMPLWIQANSQDTVTYYQKDAVLFSNSYTLIKSNATDRHGKFMQMTVTDDMQYFIGKGSFKEKGRKRIVLKFEPQAWAPFVECLSNVSISDHLHIHWYNGWGEKEYPFNIRFTDSAVSNRIYWADWQRDFVIIPRVDLKDTRLSFFIHWSEVKTLDFVVPPGINRINIYANNPFNTHVYDTKKTVLKRKKRGIKAIGMWSKKRRTLFVRREQFITY